MALHEDRTFLSGARHQTEEDYEKQLRPQSLDDFIGQQKIKDNLRVFLTAALQRGEALDHVMLSGPPGLGKCITADSLILTNEGWVPFQDLLPEDMSPDSSAPLDLTIYGVDGPEQTSHIYYSGFVPTRRITTRSGFVLEGTPHHPVLVATPEGPRWKTLGSLTANDHVAIGRHLNLWGSVRTVSWLPDANTDRRRHSEYLVTHLHRHLTHLLGRAPAGIELRNAYRAWTNAGNTPTPQRTAKRLGLPLSDGRLIQTSQQSWSTLAPPKKRHPERLTLDADLAYLLGVLVGDGHFHKDASFVITCEEPELQTEIRRISRKHFGKAPRVRKYGAKAAKLGFSQNQGKACFALGLSRAKAGRKTIPSAVLQSPREVVIGFLQGLFDADGYARKDGYVELGTRSEQLSRQVQLLLAQLGIISHRKSQIVAEQPFWRLFIGGADALAFYEVIGFRLSRKQLRGQSLPARHRGWSRSDLVPGAVPLLYTLLQKSKPLSRAIHKKFWHVTKKDRTPTRAQIGQYLSLLPETIRQEPEYEALMALMCPTIYWDQVADIQASEADAYDFVVPGTHSFIANSFYNHNTTVGYIIAAEMGAAIHTTSGPVLDKPHTLAGLLTKLEEGDVLFIDEIHRMPANVEEYLYSAMEDYHIDILIDSGPSARSVKLSLPPFTLVGATTRKGLLTAPLRARFGIDFRYDYYTTDLLQRIVLRSAGILQTPITEDGAFEIARRSRGTPRVANRLLRRTRDFAEVESDGTVTRQIADRALNALDVDECGLDDMDARILLTLMEKFGGGPTGLSTLAVAVGEDAGTIEEVYEPFLIQEGFLDRTPRGRVAAPRAYKHFNLTAPSRTRDLFQ